MLGKGSTTELHPQPKVELLLLFVFVFVLSKWKSLEQGHMSLESEWTLEKRKK
jgi:hypothetical protein